MSKVLPFKYFGSKYRSFGFINSKLPRTRQYIEPYGGAGTILLNRDPVPVETINDLHEDIPNFFRVLRDSPGELIDQLRKTPYSRSEYSHAIQMRNEGYPDCSDLERARLFFLIMQMSRSSAQNRSTAGCWSYSVKGGTGRGTDKRTSTWKSRLETLETVSGRLTDVQIECKPALDVIETHDRDTAVFYADPPYVPSTRNDPTSYESEMTDDDHRELAEVLRDCSGFVAISGYANDLYDDELFSNWERYEGREKGSPEGEGDRVEVLWTNYDAEEIGGEKIGDWPTPRRKGQQLTLTGAAQQPKK